MKSNKARMPHDDAEEVPSRPGSTSRNLEDKTEAAEQHHHHRPEPINAFNRIKTSWRLPRRRKPQQHQRITTNDDDDDDSSVPSIALSPGAYPIVGMGIDGTGAVSGNRDAEGRVDESITVTTLSPNQQSYSNNGGAATAIQAELAPDIALLISTHRGQPQPHHPHLLSLDRIWWDRSKMTDSVLGFLYRVTAEGWR